VKAVEIPKSHGDGDVDAGRIAPMTKQEALAEIDRR